MTSSHLHKQLQEDLFGEVLKEKGVSLEEIIESGRKERGSIIEKQYGLKSNKNK